MALLEKPAAERRAHAHGFMECHKWRRENEGQNAIGVDVVLIGILARSGGVSELEKVGWL
ncbi:MAG TPA: hypothetical protein VH482_05175 [Thermomicrobiales bacterium]